MNKQIKRLLDHRPLLSACATEIQRSYELLRGTFLEGGKLLICGNGGSAADADHLAGELLKSFEIIRPISEDLETRLREETARQLQGALPAIPLTAFNAFSTAFQNDCNAEYVYAQLTLALGQEKDALFCISTSGKSPNVIHAAEVARAIGMQTVALTGDDGGYLRSLVDVCIRAPESEVAAIQELHLPIYHTLCRMLEETFFGDATSRHS